MYEIEPGIEQAAGKSGGDREVDLDRTRAERGGKDQPEQLAHVVVDLRSLDGELHACLTAGDPKPRKLQKAADGDRNRLRPGGFVSAIGAMAVE